jgi:hypothetical protein
VAGAFERIARAACPAAATIDVEWLLRYDGAATPLNAAELEVAGVALDRNFGRRPALVRNGAGLLVGALGG